MKRYKEEKEKKKKKKTQGKTQRGIEHDETSGKAKRKTTQEGGQQHDKPRAYARH
jgi:hypothetical protein